MKYIVVNNNIIKNIVQSSEGLKEVKKMFHLSGEIFEIDKSVPVIKGKDIRIYDNDWNIKPLQQLVDEGFETIPEGFEIKDNQFVKIPEEPEEELTEEEIKERDKFYKNQEKVIEALKYLDDTDYHIIKEIELDDYKCPEEIKEQRSKKRKQINLIGKDIINRSFEK